VDISSSGLVTLEFNKPMQIVSNFTLFKEIGSLQVLASEEIAGLDFVEIKNWEAVFFEDKVMELQLTFEQPFDVSSYSDKRQNEN